MAKKSYFPKELIGPWGGDMTLWTREAFVIRRFITKEKLKPIPVDLRVGGSRVRIPPWFPGIPVPHLHFRGRCYRVTQAQWKRFSGAVIRNLKVRMGKIKSVRPEQLAAMADVIAGK